MNAISADPPGRDPFDPRVAAGATGLLREFNQGGVLSAADVHVATRLGELAGEDSEDVRLAVALAVRAPRYGHVFVDLATIRDTATVETEEAIDPAALAWPPASAWPASVAGSQLVAVGDDDPAVDQPLRLLGTRLYLDRYWREERSVAAGLARFAAGVEEIDEDEMEGGLARLFPADADAHQRAAAAAAVRRRFAVVAGGPGTGKTTTVARIVALLLEQAAAAGNRPPLIALAAPTGKAAARLQEAVQAETARLPVSEATRAHLLGLQAATLHRLLGWRRGSHSRFAHGPDNRLPHDVVIVDETSMVSLWQMARLVEAIRPESRLILVGDPGQLTSIEAGVVLADIVGDAERRRADGIVVLERVHRYGGGIATVAEAIRDGDEEATIAALRSAPEGVSWLGPEATELLRARALAAGRSVVEAARAGDGRAALDALGRFRLLCAHRRGPYGARDWNDRVQAWLASELGDLDLEERDYVGRPLLVSENDYELGLYNGDGGVIVRDRAGRPSAVFERGGELLGFSPLRLGAVETVYAMTIHKSQGSQFDTAVVLLPPPSSRILTRELLYTAVTRARRELILIGTEEAVRAAVARPVARASGLAERLYGGVSNRHAHSAPASPPSSAGLARDDLT